MSVIGDIFLGLFYQNWSYLLIVAAVILVILGAVGVVWYIYCSDRARRYKVKPLPPRQGREDGIEEVEEMAACPLQEDLPPPVPELLRSMRRERSRQQIGENVTSSQIQDDHSGHLVKEDDTMKKEGSAVFQKTITPDTLTSRSEPPNITLEQRNRPSQLRLQHQESMTSQQNVTSPPQAMASSEDESAMSFTTKREAIAKRLSAPWRSSEEETPTIPFRSCDSFVYNQSPAEYRKAHRAQEEQPSSPAPEPDVVRSPRDVITLESVSRDVTTPESISRDVIGTKHSPSRNISKKERLPSQDVIKAPRTPTRGSVKPQRSLSFDVIQLSREDMDKPRTLQRSETHGIVNTRRESRTLPRNTAFNSRETRRVSVDDNRYSTQLSTGELSPKHLNGPLSTTFEELCDYSYDGSREIYVDQGNNEELRLYENNRDTVRKQQNKVIERYGGGFSLPKYHTASKVQNSGQSASRDVTTSCDVTTASRAHSHKRSNTVQAPWAHRTSSIEYSRENNLDCSAENLDGIDQFGSVGGRYGGDDFSDNDLEFLEPTIYANQGASFYGADL